MRRLLAVLVTAGALLVSSDASAGAKGNAWSSLMVNKLFRGDATALPSSLTARLYTICPTASTAGTEVSATGYSAPSITSNTTNWAAASGGATSNATTISFGTAGADWTGINCVGLTSGTDLYYFGPLVGAPVTVLNGETATLPASALAVSELDSAVETPTFSPAAGAVSSGTTVTASTATSGATMYTGSTDPPTTASATFSVTSAGTWYAQAKKSGADDSAVASAAYTISAATPALDTGFPVAFAGGVAGGTSQTLDISTSGTNRLILVFVMTQGNAEASIGVSGSVLGAYSLIYDPDYVAGVQYVRVYGKYAAAQTTETVTVTMATSTEFWAVAMAYSGAKDLTAGGLTQATSGNGWTGDYAVANALDTSFHTSSTISLTPTQAGSKMLVWGDAWANTAITGGASTTVLAHGEWDQAYVLAERDGPLSAGSSYTATLTHGSQSTNFAAIEIRVP